MSVRNDRCCLLTLLLSPMALGGAVDTLLFAPDPPYQIPLELLAGRPVIRATINGEGPFAVLIDPQRRTTLVDAATAARLGPPGADAADGLTADFGFGQQKIADHKVQIGDTSRIVPELGAAARLAAVLSVSAWREQLVTIDYSRLQVRIESGALPDPNGRDVYALEQETLELRTLTIGEHSIPARIDLLFPAGVLLPSAYLKSLPLATKVTEATPAWTRGGHVAVREARLAQSVVLAGTESQSPSVLFGDVADRAIVGSGWLARRSVTYDVSRARARLNPAR